MIKLFSLSIIAIMAAAALMTSAALAALPTTTPLLAALPQSSIVTVRMPICKVTCGYVEGRRVCYRQCS